MWLTAQNKQRMELTIYISSNSSYYGYTLTKRVRSMSLYSIVSQDEMGELFPHLYIYNSVTAVNKALRNSTGETVPTYTDTGEAVTTLRTETTTYTITKVKLK